MTAFREECRIRITREVRKQMCIQLVPTCSRQLEGAQGHCGQGKAGVRPAHAVHTPCCLSQVAHSPARVSAATQPPGHRKRVLSKGRCPETLEAQRGQLPRPTHPPQRPLPLCLLHLSWKLVRFDVSLGNPVHVVTREEARCTDIIVDPGVSFGDGILSDLYLFL